jgi:hypothetical protein
MDAFAVPVLPESAETAIAGAVLAGRILRSEAANKPAASFCFLQGGDGRAITGCGVGVCSVLLAGGVDETKGNDTSPTRHRMRACAAGCERG